jgi:hypothetical protein
VVQCMWLTYDPTLYEQKGGQGRLGVSARGERTRLDRVSKTSGTLQGLAAYLDLGCSPIVSQRRRNKIPCT